MRRFERMQRRDWKDPFSWFNWYQTTKKPVPFLYRPAGGRVGQAGMTHTRADSTTCATYRDSSGIWQTAAANILREGHWHYDSTLGYSVLTTLREGAGTNSALGACNFNAAGTYYDGAGTFTISEAVTSCISGQTAYKHTAAGAARYRSQAVGTFVNAQSDCDSWILENDLTVPATTSDIKINDETAGAALVTATLTWATKTAAITAGAGTCGVIDLGTGPNGGAMVRVWVTGTGTGAGTGAAGNTRRTYCYPAANTKAVILHHHQFEAATSVPSSPIVTVGSAVTRAADLWSFPWTRTPEAGTWYVDAIDLMGATAAGTFPVGLFVGSGTTAPLLSLHKASGNWTGLYKNAAEDMSSSSAAAGAAYGNRVELRPFLAVSGANVTTTLGQSINSAAEVVAAAGTARAIDAAYAGTPPTLNIGVSGGGGDRAANLAIRSLCYVPEANVSMDVMRQIARG